jgi:SNF2 family DNA or RNA helicase
MVGKLIFLENLLNFVRKVSLLNIGIAGSKYSLLLGQHTEEKVALVSHYTTTLDLIETYCQKKKYTYFRLDGYTT